MALSLEQLIKKFKFSDVLPPPEPEKPAEAGITDEYIDLSKVIKRKSSLSPFKKVVSEAREPEQKPHPEAKEQLSIEKLIPEIKHLKEEKREQEQKISYLRDEVTQKTALSLRLREDYSALQEELQSIKSRLAPQTNTIQKQAATIEAQSGELALLRKEKEHFAEENRLLKDALKSPRPDLIRQTEESFKEELKRLQNVISERETELNQKEKQLNQDREEAKNTRERLQTLQSNLSSIQSQLSELPDVKKALEQVEESNSKQREEISRLQNEIAQKEKETSPLKEQFQSLQAERDTIKKNLAEKNQLIQEQIRTVLALEEKTSQLEAKHASERQQMLHDLKEIQASKSSLESRISEYKQMASMLESDLQNAGDKMDAMNKKGAARDRLITFLCVVLLVISLVLLFMYRSNNQLMQKMSYMSSALDQKDHIIQSKKEETNLLTNKIERNFELVQQQVSKIVALNKNIEWQGNKISALTRTLVAKEDEVVKLRAELEQTRQDFFRYRQKIRLPDQASSRRNLDKKQKKQPGVINNRAVTLSCRHN